MASPHMAGVLALMKSVNPSLTPDQVDTLLAAGRLTTDIGAAGRDDNFGHGLIDALKAVQAAGAGAGGGATPALLVASPTSVNLSPTTSSQTITVGNGGDQTLRVTAVQVPAPANAWLTVEGPAAANGLGNYTINVNRTGLAPGAYSGAVRFVSSANAVIVNVVMQVGRTGVGISGNLGRQYIILLDAETLESKFQVIAPTPTAGAYKFQFTGIPAGTYKLFTGNDADNNGKICELGETCGTYINLAKPADVVVSGNRSDLIFNAEHLTSFGVAAATDAATTRAPVIQRLR